MIGTRYPARVIARESPPAKKMSCRVLFSTCPMVSMPVILGGGMTMVKGFFVESGSAWKRRCSSQNAYQVSSTLAGSYAVEGWVAGVDVSDIFSPINIYRVRPLRMPRRGESNKIRRFRKIAERGCEIEVRRKRNAHPSCIRTRIAVKHPEPVHCRQRGYDPSCDAPISRPAHFNQLVSGKFGQIPVPILRKRKREAIML
jgi:hypothetical protein